MVQHRPCQHIIVVLGLWLGVRVSSPECNQPPLVNLTLRFKHASMHCLVACGVQKIFFKRISRSQAEVQVHVHAGRSQHWTTLIRAAFETFPKASEEVLLRGVNPHVEPSMRAGPDALAAAPRLMAGHATVGNERRIVAGISSFAFQVLTCCPPSRAVTRDIRSSRLKGS